MAKLKLSELEKAMKHEDMGEYSKGKLSEMIKKKKRWSELKKGMGGMKSEDAIAELEYEAEN